MAREYTYARDTPVPVEQTIVEIRKIVTKHSAAQFVFGVSEDRLMIGFTKDGRQVRCQTPQDPKNEQRSKSLARALLLVVKAKLEAVAAGVVTFEDEFMGHIVLPDGKSVAQQAKAYIASAYEGRDMPHMLPDYSTTTSHD